MRLNHAPVELSQQSKEFVIAYEKQQHDNQLNSAQYDDIAQSYLQVTLKHASDEHKSIKIAISQLEILPTTVLDIGCGAGRDVAQWLDAGFDYWGIDISKRMLELAATQHPAAHFYQGDITTTSIEPSSTDIIWASSSLQHIAKAMMPIVLNNLYQGLKQGGLLYVNFRPPSPEKPKEGFVYSSEYQSTSGKSVIKRFIAHYELDEMCDLLMAAQFNIQKAEFYEERYQQYSAEKHSYLPQKCIIFAQKTALQTQS